MSKLRMGDKAPHFEGLNQEGKKISLEDFKGKRLILYFYPKDDTPGCTSESCNLSENYDMWLEKGYDVVGVSPDSEKSHARFVKKYGLKFNLIADTEKEIILNYDVWGEKSMFGIKFMGVVRTTFVIDEKGIISAIYDNVDTKNHTTQILESLNI